MKLNVGMMVDGNSRFALVEVLRSHGWEPKDILSGPLREEALAAYAERLAEVYVTNARWCVSLGEEVRSQVEGSDYSIFIYNADNRARSHYECIDRAVRIVGGELTRRLGRHGPVCIAGPDAEKKYWREIYPEWGDVGRQPNGAGNRTILLMGYQQGTGEDPCVAGMRPIDYFIRSTQMRLSGMYLPALANSQMVVMSHIPYLYSPRDVAGAIIGQAALDEEHDELNVYSQSVYEEWLGHYDTPPSITLTSNARPMRLKTIPRLAGAPAYAEAIGELV